MRALASVLLLALALPAGAQLIGEAESEITVHGFAGSGVSEAGQSKTGVTPFLLVYVHAPVGETELSMLPTIETMAALLKSPGESAVSRSNADKLEQYKTLEFSVGAQQPLVKSHRLNVGVEVGFATKLPGTTEPRDQTARWANGFVKFRSQDGFLQLGLGADQRLTGRYQPAVTVTGAVKLWTIDKRQDVDNRMKMMGFISAILGASAPTTVRNANGSVTTYSGPKTRDVVRVGIVIGL